MSILNLNTPQGRGPVGKKSMKLWMGVGLLAAVLGFGSTLAANISINNDNQSEFGQGFAQTVYCGSANPTKITVTPISAFVNSTDIPMVPEVPATWTQPVFEGRSFNDVSSSSTSRSYLNSYQSDSDGISSTIRGYWVKSRTSDDYYEGSNTPPTGDYRTFVPQVQSGGKFGFYEYDRWTPGFFSGYQAEVPASSTPAKFELGGIKISRIPSECVGRDFVLSAYGTEADPLELSDVLNVEEIAVHYGNSSNPSSAFSFDRTTAGVTTGATGKVSTSLDVNNAGGSVSILFTPQAGRLDADDVTKIIVETQDNIVGN